MIGKRFTRTLAIAATAALVLTACGDGGNGNGNGGDDPTGGEDPAVQEDELQDHMVGAMDDYDVGVTFQATEPVQFSLLYRDHPNYPIQDDWRFMTALEEDHNVTFDIVNVPLSDWGDRRALLIAAGDAPDIIPSTYIADAEQYVAGGALLPINQYLEYLPNFTDKVEKWGLEDELQEMAYQGDGNLYILPGLHEEPKPQYTVAIREDLWEAAGITEDPETWDEFKEQLQTVADANPDLTYVMSDRWSMDGAMDALLSVIAPNFGTSAGWGYGAGITYDWDAEEYVYTATTDEYRQLVEYMAGLVEDGLLDPESVNQDDDTAIAKFTSGETAAMSSNDQEILNYRNTMEESGLTDARIRNIVVPDGPAGGFLPAGGRFESGTVFSVDAAERDNFVAMLQFVDWLYYSDEGLEFSKWGIEGETFTRDGDTRVLAENIDINGLNPGAPELLNADYGFHNGVFMPAHGSTVDLVQSMLREEVQDWLNAMNERKELLPVAPAVRYDEDQRERATLLVTPLTDTTRQATAAFIVGQRPMEEWDQFVAELEGANVQGYIDLVNEAASGE